MKKVFRISEARVLKDCLQFLKLKGIFHYRQNTGAFVNKKNNRFMRFGVVGGSDIVAIFEGDKKGCKKGCFFAIEVKRPGNGVLSASQMDYLTQVKRAGGVIAVVESVSDLEKHLIDANCPLMARYEKQFLSYFHEKDFSHR